MNNFATELSSYNHIKRISDEELEAVWAEYLQDKSNKVLRDKLILQYIYLTRYVIGRIKFNLPTVFSIEDITSFGIEGLIDAIEKYMPTFKGKFETYALMRIKGNIIDKIRQEDFLPKNIRRKLKIIKETIENLRKELGRQPTSSEVGNVLGITADKVNEILAHETTITSIYDKKGSTEDAPAIIDSIEDENHVLPGEVLEERDTKKELQEALSRLTEREKMITVLYYHENMTLKEIGEIMEISESRACQLHSLAIMKLRKMLHENRAERMRQSII